MSLVVYHLFYLRNPQNRFCCEDGKQFCDHKEMAQCLSFPSCRLKQRSIYPGQRTKNKKQLKTFALCLNRYTTELSTQYRQSSFSSTVSTSTKSCTLQIVSNKTISLQN